MEAFHTSSTALNCPFIRSFGGPFGLEIESTLADFDNFNSSFVEPRTFYLVVEPTPLILMGKICASKRWRICPRNQTKLFEATI